MKIASLATAAAAVLLALPAQSANRENGLVVGPLGISGATAAQDGEIAAAALAEAKLD